jgi:hypothetical protein
VRFIHPSAGVERARPDDTMDGLHPFVNRIANPSRKRREPARGAASMRHFLSAPRLPLLGLVCALALSAAQATTRTAWDEAVSGDLSNAGTSPTAVTLLPGSNLIRGVTGRSGGVVDRDYFSFTLPEGWQLDTLTVLPGTTFVTASDAGFIAVQAGPQVTVNPTGGSPEGLLGWLHYSQNDMGTDILGLMGIAFGASGFVTPLPAGVYSFWIQNTSTGVSAYNLDFAVSVVPELPAVALLAAGLAGLGGLRKLRAASPR